MSLDRETLKMWIGNKANPRIEIVRQVERANVWEVDGTYTVHLYGPWAGAKVYTDLKSVSFPASTRWERKDQYSRATLPGPTAVEVDLERKVMSHR